MFLVPCFISIVSSASKSSESSCRVPYCTQRASYPPPPSPFPLRLTLINFCCPAPMQHRRRCVTLAMCSLPWFHGFSSGPILRGNTFSPPGLYASLHVSPHSPIACALITARRFQSSAATDKKYHCSICNKGFRLEMAAKVHLQQAHQGQGAVMAGGGTESNADTATTQPSPSPPSAPTTPTEYPSSAPQSSAGFSPFRKSRPAPKPLNASEHDLPDAIMKALLGVWDDIGVSRLGESFIHSSMVVKVAAGTSHTSTAAPSPFARPSSGDESGGATPTYGQVPMYGQPAPTTTGSPAASQTTVASPFAAAPLSPFAAAVSSPFAQPATPFVDSAADTSSAAPSPFGSNVSNPSPFVNADMANSPFTSDLSQFAASSAAPSSLNASFVPPAVAAPAPDLPTQIPCSTCGRLFTSHDGMRMHAKAKHNIDVPRAKSEKKRRGQNHDAADLPPYVPSPVDIHMTAPFASVAAEARWDETVLRLHSATVNSIVLIGTLVEVARLSDDKTQLSVAVASPDAATAGASTETFVVRCASSMIRDAEVGCRVCIQGNLRMLPISESGTDSPIYAPLITVSEASGIVAKLRA